MQGLYTLYDPTGRRAEWAALVGAVTPELVGPDDGPLPGRVGQWSLITQYRVLPRPGGARLGHGGADAAAQR